MSVFPTGTAARPVATEGALALAASPATRDGRPPLQAVPGLARSRKTLRGAGETAEGLYDDLHHALLLAKERGEQIPCFGSDRDAWVSDVRADRKLAAGKCADCPALVMCGEYANFTNPEGGVWGGKPRGVGRIEPPANPPFPKARRCSCGCGDWTKGGRYLPGHDARHLARLVKYIRAGAISEAGALKALADTPALQAKLARHIR